MSGESARLLLVYNADGGLWGEVSYFAKKLVGAAGCSLCDITHKMTGERAEWQSCRDRLPIAVEQLHRNELDQAAVDAAAGRYPCVLLVRNGQHRRIVDPEELERCKGDVVSFRKLLEERTGDTDVSC